MKIKNLTTKAIGFGTVTIMPDATGEIGDTPKTFGKGHPLTDYYLSRGWIKEIGGAVATVANSGSLSVNVNVGAVGANADSENPGDEQLDKNDPDGADDKIDQLGNVNTGNPAAAKSIDRMNKEELIALAATLGVEVAESETRLNILEKVRAAKQADK